MKKKTSIKGKPINPNIAIGRKYEAKLWKLIKRMTDETERELRRLYKSDMGETFFAQDDSISSQARIIMNKLMKKYEKLFADHALNIAKQFTTASHKEADNATRRSLRELAEGFSIGRMEVSKDMKEILKATIAENVGLIKSIPQKYLHGIQGAVMRSITTGNGLQDLNPYMMRHRAITHRRARMIALDQTRKASVNISVQRMKDAGFTKFQWLHTGGGKTSRDLHKKLDGKVFEFAHPPLIQRNPTVYGLPGQLPNCRCRPRAILELS